MEITDLRVQNVVQRTLQLPDSAGNAAASFLNKQVNKQVNKQFFID